MCPVDRWMSTRPNPLWILSVCEQHGPIAKALLIYSWFLIPSRMADPILALTGQHSRSQTAVPQDWAQQHARASFPALPLPLHHSLCQNCVASDQTCFTVYKGWGQFSFSSVNWDDHCSYCLDCVDTSVSLIYTAGTFFLHPEVAPCPHTWMERNIQAYWCEHFQEISMSNHWTC